MKKNQNKTVNGNNLLNEIQRVGVLVEQVDDKVSVMAEMLTDVKKVQDKHTIILNKHDDTLDLHTEVLDAMMKKLDTKVDRSEFETRLRPLERKLA